MSLQSLVFCSDEKVVKVLRRVLGDLEIAVEPHDDGDAVVRKLTRSRYEAVIIDWADPKASDILKSVRSAPCNKRAIAVAMVDSQTALRNAFALGAHFVLYKPISYERARASFRAARALMRRERRRNTRVPVQIEVMLLTDDGKKQSAKSTDLGEGGVAVNIARRPPSPLHLRFTVPGTEFKVECKGEVAWENAGQQAGIRFRDLSMEAHSELKAWITRQLAEPEPEDPPLNCKLTDLSLGGCYLEVSSPFPAKTRVMLSMKVGDLRIQAEGVVRVLHAEVGMGVEFTRNTSEQRAQVEKFIQALISSDGQIPNILVEPQGLESELPASSDSAPASGIEDPLIDLFYKKADLTAESFLAELRRQRRGNNQPAETACSA